MRDLMFANAPAFNSERLYDGIARCGETVAPLPEYIEAHCRCNKSLNLAHQRRRKARNRILRAVRVLRV
jgi:hypothetical protein